MGKATKKFNIQKCPYCDKKIHDHDGCESGVYEGSSSQLARRLINDYYKNKTVIGQNGNETVTSVPEHFLSTIIGHNNWDLTDDSDYARIWKNNKKVAYDNASTQSEKDEILKKFNQSTAVTRVAAAHHLIPCEIFENDGYWQNLCMVYGYNINRSGNGVFLPQSYYIACDLAIPLHRGGHTHKPIFGTDKEKDRYKRFGEEKLDTLKGKWNPNNTPCNDPKKKFIEEMDQVSEDIWEEIRKFNLTLTKGGKRYRSTSLIGCSGEDYRKFQKKADNALKKAKKQNVASITVSGKEYEFCNRVQDPDRKHIKKFSDRAFEGSNYFLERAYTE